MGVGPAYKAAERRTIDLCSPPARSPAPAAPPPPATPRADELTAKILDKLEAMSDVQAKLSDRLLANESAVQSKFNDLSSKLGRIGGGGGGGESKNASRIECLACGQRGHRIADCPAFSDFKGSKSKGPKKPAAIDDQEE
jgi:hypothetical protein